MMKLDFNSMLKDWNLMRIFRIVIGVVILINGIKGSENAIILFGGIFTLLAVLNIGCGPQGCSVPTYKMNSDKEEEVIYEEVK